MTFTVDITPKTPTGVIDQTKQFTATPSGETGGGTITYAWTVDDAPQDGSELKGELDVNAMPEYPEVVKKPAAKKAIPAK